MRLSDFILNEIPAILAEWDEFARTLKPAASNMTFRELRNHAEHMLRSIAKDIASEQSGEEQVDKSHGDEVRNSQIVSGEEHGLARLDSRFTTEQLAAEFRALRASVLKLWGEKVNLTSPDILEIIRFNEAIDQLLAASISSFAQATRKLMEDEVRRREQFLAMLAHELRNPLAPISASATLLKVAPNDILVVNKASNIIARQISHITGLVDDLLDVSRVNNGSVVLKKENLDFRCVVDGALEQVIPTITAKHHWLDTPQLEEQILVWGDSARLIQILTNLLVNSAKYTPEGGHIRLNVDAHLDYVEVSVEDNGIGIEPEFIPHIFELFSQANPSLDRSSAGLGLGLSLVKSLVEQHSGNVKCYSDGVGKGSKFTVWLPTNTDEIQLQDSPDESGAVFLADKQLKVMIVDDNVDAAETLELLLETLGYEVVIAHSSTEALSKSGKELPDALLLDIGLPIMDGHELARKIRLIPALSNSVLIALTGYSEARDRDEAMNAGFHHFMTKPVDIKKLQSILESVIPR